MFTDGEGEHVVQLQVPAVLGHLKKREPCFPPRVFLRHKKKKSLSVRTDITVLNAYLYLILSMAT